MKDFLICVKRTKWQRDLERFGTAREVRRIYRLQNGIFRRVYASHLRQVAALDRLRSCLGGRADFIYREDLSFERSGQYRFLVSLGGDNHFIFTARYARDVPMLGINSDPATSTGALVYFRVESFLERFCQPPSLPTRFESWAMFEGRIFYPDGSHVDTGPCISECDVRSGFADAISRYYLRINEDAWEEQKSSGLLLSTGAGSTGWFHNCLPGTIQAGEDSTFPRDSQFFRFVTREPGFHRRHFYRYLYHTIDRGDVLELISEMDGQIIIDSHPETSFAFPPGARCEFRVSDRHLRVAIP